MRSSCVFVLLLSSLAFAQAKPQAGTAGSKTTQTKPASAPAPAKPSVPAAKPAEVPETAPVITINGVCAKKVPGTPCRTVITRREFEKTLAAVAPARAGNPEQLPANVKHNMAEQLAQLLVVANAAEEKGIQNTPEAQQLLKFARMQALAQAYTRDLQQKLKPTEAEIQSFYEANKAKLEEATLQRVVIPKEKAEETKAKPEDAAAKTNDEAAEKAKAEKIRERLVAGEPANKLQEEVLQGTKFKTPPETKIVVQKGTLPANQETVFDLKPGEVSQLYEEPTAYFIYKLESKQTIPLDQVKGEIEQQLLQEKMQAALEGILKTATPVLNEEYFGSSAPATAKPGLPSEPRPQQPTTEKPKNESKPK